MKNELTVKCITTKINEENKLYGFLIVKINADIPVAIKSILETGYKSAPVTASIKKI